MLYAVYGNHLSFYGNIGLAQAPKLIKNYGGWPDDIPVNSPMVNNYPIETIPEVRIEPIVDNIAIIKRLRAELAQTEDTQKRILLRSQIEAARQEKVKAFQLQARLEREEDDEASFILLH